MLKKILLLLICAVPRVGATPILSSDGYGAVKFGESLVEVEKTLHERANLLAPAEYMNVPEIKAEYEACGYVTFNRYSDVQFMVERGVITRADVGKKVVNEFNIFIGDNFK